MLLELRIYSAECVIQGLALSFVRCASLKGIHRGILISEDKSPRTSQRVCIREDHTHRREMYTPYYHINYMHDSNLHLFRSLHMFNSIGNFSVWNRTRRSCCSLVGPSQHPVCNVKWTAGLYPGRSDISAEACTIISLWIGMRIVMMSRKYYKWVMLIYLAKQVGVILS